MNWDRSETLALAKESCTQCHGFGLRPGRQGRETPCKCVFRAIFRACYTRFRDLTMEEKWMSCVRVEFGRSQKHRLCYGRKHEEYLADFDIISRRTLDDPLEYDIFRFHFLLGADWKLCCRRLNMDRGDFFHSVYRIEQKLGQAFRETKPYGLFPLDEYFGGAYRNPLPTQPLPVVPIRIRTPLQPPMLLTA